MKVLEYRSGFDEKPRDAATELLRGWLGWAFYLGASWTWCIGMFLPALLIRDYGFWSWVIFAVPNVVGAAAMGWVLREGQSEHLVAQHTRAIETFSFITATFQIFFALWMFTIYGPAWATLIVIGAAVVLAMLAKYELIRLVAGLVLTFSMMCMALSPELPGELPAKISAPVALGLSSVCVFGFALCPYLDGTLHQARQALPSGRASFSVGFGFLFLMMILFTLHYAPALIGWTSVKRIWPFIAAHWTAQLAFTTGVHWRVARIPWRQVVLTMLFAGVLWVMLRFIRYGEINPGELIYRLFMSFYGLIFPAYVWICMTPTWRQPLAPSRMQWTVLAIAVVVAAPFYWVAFIDGKMGWVVPGVLIVLAARFAVPKTKIAA